MFRFITNTRKGLKAMGIASAAAALALMLSVGTPAADAARARGGLVGSDPIPCATCVQPAQAKLVVNVYDAGNPISAGPGIGQPIEGALVRIAKSGSSVVYGGYTDKYGQFATQLPEGQYTVTVIAEGYKATSQDVKASASQTASLSVGLTK